MHFIKEQFYVNTYESCIQMGKAHRISQGLFDLCFSLVMTCV